MNAERTKQKQHRYNTTKPQTNTFSVFGSVYECPQRSPTTTVEVNKLTTEQRT